MNLNGAHPADMPPPRDRPKWATCRPCSPTGSPSSWPPPQLHGGGRDHAPPPSTATSPCCRRSSRSSIYKFKQRWLNAELQSSRITLLLSVVFVAIYICSWWWMAFAIKQVSQGGSVSLKTVLLLAVFAAVDIAASTGFVLLRLIMYIRRDRFYPNALKPLSAQTESDQMASYTALRLITIKSSCGNADILVTVVVGFLTVLRIYSVVCVASFYKKAKNGSRDIFQKEITGSCDTSDRTESIKDFDEYTPKSLIMDYAKKKPTSHCPQRSQPSFQHGCTVYPTSRG
ncbi:uncharacterized protein CEXT_621651 [Caerostris extrusa]|uniref:Uncharacterized protein n=1 Tax=Caerostris extrusa TaxID=172846 RepID=A0AAV4XCC4_CAEEX|nr:uncharacterized protein CEXT_621651 [Caerostris extrusa]